MNSLFRNAGSDIPASIVVFLVALPLCLGVAVASNALPITGIIAGVVGGIVVGLLSGSSLSVSGPAAGLTAIVAVAIGKMPTYDVFLLSVVLAGVFQLVLGFAKSGFLGEFIPNPVIKGMLAAIGIILILKQLPHFVGFDVDPEGDESFIQADNENTFTAIFSALRHFSGGAIIIGLVSVIILLVYETKQVKYHKISTILPGPLVVVGMGILLSLLFKNYLPNFAIAKEHLVKLPVFAAPTEFFTSLVMPNFNAITSKQVWITAFTLAIVASLETLLSIEAVDKIDPKKRISPANKELKAQGVGNIVSGLLGGLPVTSVIVRSSANVNAGGTSKLSAILHGCWLLLAVLFFPKLLNLIPLSALAAILIFTGYKLAKISLFRDYYRKGWTQFVPFIVTVLAILLTDLLIGICIGIVTGLFFVMQSNFKAAIFTMKDEYRYLIRFRKEVSFLNKPALKKVFAAIPDNTAVLIDATKSAFIDNDIVEMVNDFIVNAETRSIRVYIKYSSTQSRHYFNDTTKRIID